MEGKGRDDVIGIGIAPGMRHRGIIDGQNLNDLHTCGLSPVYQTAQVSEVAHAKGVFTAQREDRHHHASRPPHALLHPEATTVDDQHRAVGHHCLVWRQEAVGGAVVAFLPGHEGIRCIIDYHIFIFEGQKHGIDIDREHPVVLAHILHPQESGSIPVAQGRMAAQDGQRLALLQLWSRHTEEDGLAIERHPKHLVLFTAGQAHRRGVGTAVEMILQGNVTPLVRQDITLRRVEMIGTGHTPPFAAQDIALAVFHLIKIGEGSDGVLSRLNSRSLQCPEEAVVGRHQQIRVPDGAVEAPVGDDHVQALAPLRAVIYGKSQFHNRIIFCKDTK